MLQNAWLDRISSDPGVLAGKPVIRGTRLAVAYILGLLANGATEAEILDEYEGLESEDIRACLGFALHTLEAMPSSVATRAS